MRDMKKFLIFLITLLILLCISGCSPKFTYFATETRNPQEVVDSLLSPVKTTYHSWIGFQTLGINAGDSTVISTYVYSIGNKTVTVVEYGNSDLMSVTEKKRKR